MESPNLDFFDFELENFVVMLMVYRSVLFGKLVNDECRVKDII